MFYKICASNAYEYIEADNEEQAKAVLAEMICDLNSDIHDSTRVEDNQSFIREVSIDECVAEEEFMLKMNLSDLYVKLHYDLDKITVKEYGRLQHNIKHDPKTKWIMLKDINGLNRQYVFLEKICDMDKMPSSVYKETAKKLLLAIGTLEYEKIIAEISKEYGKEQYRREMQQDKSCPSSGEKNTIQ